MCSLVDDQCEGPPDMADLPPEHGSAKTEAGIRRIVAQVSGIVAKIRWLLRFLLDSNSCVLSREIIQRLAAIAFILAPKAMSMQEAGDACFVQQQTRRK
jgi:hypothetical protein